MRGLAGRLRLRDEGVRHRERLAVGPERERRERDRASGLVELRASRRRGAVLAAHRAVARERAVGRVSTHRARPAQRPAGERSHGNRGAARGRRRVRPGVRTHCRAPEERGRLDGEALGHPIREHLGAPGATIDAKDDAAGSNRVGAVAHSEGGVRDAQRRGELVLDLVRVAGRRGNLRRLVGARRAVEDEGQEDDRSAENGAKHTSKFCIACARLRPQVNLGRARESSAITRARRSSGGDHDSRLDATASGVGGGARQRVHPVRSCAEERSAAQALRGSLAWTCSSAPLRRDDARSREHDHIKGCRRRRVAPSSAFARPARAPRHPRHRARRGLARVHRKGTR